MSNPQHTPALTLDDPSDYRTGYLAGLAEGRHAATTAAERAPNVRAHSRPNHTPTTAHTGTQS